MILFTFATQALAVQMMATGIVVRSAVGRSRNALHLGVQIGADTRDFALGDPGVGAESFDEIVDLAGSSGEAHLFGRQVVQTCPR